MGGRVARRVVGLGLAVVDHLYRVDRLDLARDRIRYRERCVAAGGMTATALAQAARLGCRAQILSAVGDDADGRLVRRELRRAGVDTRRLVLSPGLPTTVAVVLVARSGGERRFVLPERRGLEGRAPRFDLSPIARDSVLLLDGHFPDQALRAARRAQRAGAQVVGDFQQPSAAVRRLLPLVDFPIVSHEFAAACGLSDADALRWLARHSRGAAVVTQGRRGGAYLDGGRVRRFRPVATRAIDTTGAGDAFHGAFAAGLCHGLEVAAAIELAALAAARNCRVLGGSTGLVGLRDLGPSWRRHLSGRRPPDP